MTVESKSTVEKNVYEILNRWVPGPPRGTVKGKYDYTELLVMGDILN